MASSKKRLAIEPAIPPRADLISRPGRDAAIARVDSGAVLRHPATGCLSGLGIGVVPPARRAQRDDCTSCSNSSGHLGLAGRPHRLRPASTGLLCNHEDHLSRGWKCLE